MSLIVHNIHGKRYIYDHHRVHGKVVSTYIGKEGDIGTQQRKADKAELKEYGTKR